MRFVQTWIKAIVAAFFVSIMSCAPIDKQPDNRRAFISKVLDTLDVPASSKRFLFTSTLTCQTCIEHAINSFAQLPNVQEFTIISIGSSKKDVEYLNYFYSRQKIQFLYVHPSLLDSLLVQDKAFATSLVYCVKKLPNGERRFFDGVLQDTSKYISSNAAIQFLTAP
jgi:hypothetical protein